ncbi:MAG TPA: hypothetical protein DCZ94_04935 [Lentisphaeria bacterium]|nr:MAG: hypothetical protein A2X48_07875 [Lentisphaerae bacterium GWF2_49_21]HBC86282.1 hypothetical protein [Lentisphaeria bacterium]
MNIHKVPKSPIKSSAADLVASRFRQIHLDFHTSEHIPDVGAKFDPDVFAGRLADAKVNWVTLFAKCHHGLSYYPTKVGTVHPSLKFDLLGEQVEACRRKGIVTPAYISVRVDENNARIHPEWIGRMKDNKFWKWGDALAAGWFNHCMNNTEYVDELIAQAEEVIKWYDVEGIFYDMCYNPDPGCYCPRCYDSMKKLGLDFTSDDDHRKFEFVMTRDYTKRIAKAVRGFKKNATIFFNGRMRPGICEELDVFSHLEIEALPTGGWGYAFFPIHARYARTLGMPVQGMTGRFHKSWADFGGLKTEDQFIYETGSILAANCVMNVGDQCHPRGILDKGAYQMIGKAFSHVEKCEPWCVKAEHVSEIGVVMLPVSANDTNSSPAGTSKGMQKSPDGAGRMLLELKQQFDLVYPEHDLSKYKVLVLPDSGYVSPEFRKKLSSYISKGIAVIASYKTGLEDGKFGIPGLPVKYVKDNEYKPSYLKLGAELGKNLPESEFVFYEDSVLVEPAKGTESFGNLCTSYFNRKFDRFCSHNQTPFDKVLKNPIAVVKGNIAYIAPNIFLAYREHAFPLYKSIFSFILDKLLAEPLVKAKAPSAMEISLNKQKNPARIVAHMVNFQPQRRHTNVEWIEELYPVKDIALGVRTGFTPARVYLAPEKKGIPFKMSGGYCQVAVPEVKAHQMVVFEK